jgi:hypothetical protein
MSCRAMVLILSVQAVQVVGVIYLFFKKKIYIKKNKKTVK